MMDAARLGFDPFIDWWLICVLGLLCFAMWGLYIWKRGRAWLTRAFGLSLILLVLSNPLYIQENRDPLKSTVALIIDRSTSMSVTDREDLAQQVSETMTAQVNESEAFDLRFVETPADAENTALVDAMISLLEDVPRSQIAGSILVTDGQVHDIPNDVSALSEFGPVHSLIIGDENETDRRIEVVSAPSYGIVGDEITLTVRATAEVPVLSLNVSTGDGTPQTVAIQPGFDAEIRVEVGNRGPNTIVLSIPEAENELTTANNITAVTYTGIRDTLRVLLITGEPHQGGRAWRDLLKSDPMVDLVHFTILRPPHKQDATPTSELALISFPTAELFEEKLDEFDLIIFDQYRRRNVLQLRYLDNIARYVDRGGALLIAAGPQFATPQSLHRTPLASVLPLSPTGNVEQFAFKPQISELGQRHTVTKSLDPARFGHWYRYIEARPVTGDILLETPDGRPLMALDRVGDGRVAELMSDQLWLWARGHDGGGPFTELIRRLVHWMMKEPELEEEYLSLSSNSDSLIATLSTLDTAPDDLELELPNGQTVSIPWQRNQDATEFTIEENVQRLGLYRARVGDLEALHLHGPAQPAEFADLRSTEDILAPLAAESQGSVQRVTSASQIPSIRATRQGGSGSDWIGLRDRDAYVVTDSQTTAMVPPWLAAGMLFGLLLLAWRREGS